MVHPYVATKWAVRGLAKSAAIELGKFNIRINSLHPRLHSHADDQALPPTTWSPRRSAAPGECDEVATFVVFLASDESSFSTGAEFVVDGGLVTDVPHKDLF